MYVGDIAYAIPQGAHRMKVPLRGSDVRRKFIGDEFQGRVVREVEGAALEMRFASNRRNVGSNPMLSAHFLNKNSTAVFTCPVLFLYVNDVPCYFQLLSLHLPLLILIKPLWLLLAKLS